MRTSGVVLDIYDDVGGQVLRSMVSSKDDLPAFVKQAHAITPDERAKLPDDAFALVLLNGEEKLRKFACIDEGNTALSVLYFLKNAHKLPEEARGVAAENLKVACGWYGLDVPEELEKEAVSRKAVVGAVRNAGASSGRLADFAKKMTDKGHRANALAQYRGGFGSHADSMAQKFYGAAEEAGRQITKRAGLAGMAFNAAAKNPVGTAMTAMTAPSLVRGTSQNIKANLAKVRAGEAAGGVSGGLGAMAGHGMEHLASAFGVKEAEVAGTSTMPLTAPPPSQGEGSKAVVKKTAHLRPVVDVTDKEAMTTVTVKRASRYALGDRYPLDNYEQVKAASAYFAEYGMLFSPAERHEYCVNLVNRAGELDIRLTDDVRKYGSEKYASSQELDMALDARRVLLAASMADDDLAILTQIKEASAVVPPEDYVALLSEFDKVAGINHLYDGDVPDPYASTYGFDKMAEDAKENFTDTIGNYYVTAADLNRLKSNKQGLKSTFGDDFCDEFCKDPVGIYKSLPVEQKKLLIRMATENSPV